LWHGTLVTASRDDQGNGSRQGRSSCYPNAAEANKRSKQNLNVRMTNMFSPDPLGMQKMFRLLRRSPAVMMEIAFSVSGGNNRPREVLLHRIIQCLSLQFEHDAVAHAGRTVSRITTPLVPLQHEMSLCRLAITCRARHLHHNGADGQTCAFSQHQTPSGWHWIQEVQAPCQPSTFSGKAPKLRRPNLAAIGPGLTVPCGTTGPLLEQIQPMGPKPSRLLVLQGE